MTEQSGNTPPPVSSSIPENDATVVIAPAGGQSGQSAPPTTAPPPPAQPEKPSMPGTSTTERGATLPLTASMTRPALAGVPQPGQSSRSPLWAILFGALSGLALFALTAMLLMNR